MSFTLTSVDSSGESIDLLEAYVLRNLNQSRFTLPKQIDTIEYPHLRDVEFQEVDIKRVSMLVGKNLTYAHLQKEARLPEDKKKRLYGCRYPLGWCVCGPYGPIVVKGFHQTLSRLILNRVFSLKNFGIWRIMGH